MGEVLTALKECIVRFFDRLFQPKEEPINEEFEFLRSQLEAERYRVDKLIDKITAKPPAKQEDEQVGELKPISGYIPWHVKRRMLEQESAAKAQQLKAERAEKLSTEELEKEMGITPEKETA